MTDLFLIFFFFNAREEKLNSKRGLVSLHQGEKKKREKYLLFSPRKEVGITHWWCFKSDSRGQLVQCWKIGCHLPLQDCGEVESLQKCKIVAKKWNLESEILLKVEGK